MKIVRYRKKDGGISYGALEAGGRICRHDGNPFQGMHVAEAIGDEPDLLSPVDPSLIIGIASNYPKHAGEMGSKVPERPTFFVKMPGALNHPEGVIRLPEKARSTRVDFEGELAVVLRADCCNVSEDEALDYVLGYTCANDVSARDWQKDWGGGQYVRGKSFDSFCPLGPCLVTREDMPDLESTRLTTHLNGELVQEASLSDMVFSVPHLIAFLSQNTTLPAGTVILTGTPPGVGDARNPPVYLKPGDSVEVAIEGIGILHNTVEAGA